MNQTDKPTGVPEDVKIAINKNYPSTFYIEDVRYDNNFNKGKVEAALYGYSLALPELTAKEEMIDASLDAIRILNEENAKLKEVLADCSKSLATYGSHPLIEKQVSDVLKNK